MLCKIIWNDCKRSLNENPLSLIKQSSRVCAIPNMFYSIPLILYVSPLASLSLYLSSSQAFFKHDNSDSYKHHQTFRSFRMFWFVFPFFTNVFTTIIKTVTLVCIIISQFWKSWSKLPNIKINHQLKLITDGML